MGTHNDGPGGAFVTSDVSGSENPRSGMEGHPLHLPSLDLGMPSITKVSKIQFMEKNKNPIFIYLADGTKLYFTWDEFKKIKGAEPTVGKSITVVFQRFPGDSSDASSQIQSVLCH